MSQEKQTPPEEVSNRAEDVAISPEVIEQAEKLAGLTFTAPERELMLKNVSEAPAKYDQLRAVSIDNAVPPAFLFNPRLLQEAEEKTAVSRAITPSPIPSLNRPDDLQDLAFYPLTHLAHLIRTRQVSSVELTTLYLDRLQRLDPVLKCVVTLTGELALVQAQQADEEIANGRYRGPLHGIPWGAKDLLAVPSFPTTWGAAPYKDQVINIKATVVQRLEEAGTVLLAKLTLGALAWGDVWFGGQTRNPWNPEEGSSGSSAGGAAATAAGLVGFAIGTETWGSIVSPCHRCGVTGLRPTFGRVSRYGAMALSWSMDKIGPIGRSVEDCALIFNAIYGPDGRDRTVVDKPFHWQPHVDLATLRIGYLKEAFEKDEEKREYHEKTLDVLRHLGADLIPVALPDFPEDALTFILPVEAAAAFDELTRSNRDDLLARQGEDAWPNVFRQARFVPAVEYIQANRLRTLLAQKMASLMSEVDLYVAPSFGPNLLLTNLTGHPAVVVPNGFSAAGVPASSITFTGSFDDEARLLAVAKAYQDATDFHHRHPPINSQNAGPEA